MPTSTVTSKGQITIPAEVRRALGLRSGSRVTFVRLADGAYEIIPAVGSVAALKGIIAPLGTSVTLDEMDDAIAAGASET